MASPQQEGAVLVRSWHAAKRSPREQPYSDFISCTATSFRGFPSDSSRGLALGWLSAAAAAAAAAAVGPRAVASGCAALCPSRHRGVGDCALDTSGITRRAPTPESVPEPAAPTTPSPHRPHEQTHKHTPLRAAPSPQVSPVASAHRVSNILVGISRSRTGPTRQSPDKRQEKKSNIAIWTSRRCFLHGKTAQAAPVLAVSAQPRIRSPFIQLFSHCRNRCHGPG